MNLFQLIQQGGPVMYILAILSIIALATISYKIFHYKSLGIWGTDLIQSSITNLKSGNIKKAISILDNPKKPCAKVTKIAIEACIDNNLRPEDVSAEIRRVGGEELRKMESHLRGLSVIAHLAPLIGLLGTVIGMITAFIALEKTGGQANPALLAGGIWEALLTTAYGLALAIPCLAAYYFLENEVDKAKARMKNAVTQVLIVFNRASNEKAIPSSSLSEENYSF